MTQMQVSVRFRRETGHDAVHFAFCEVFLYDFFQKIEFTLFHNLTVISPQRYEKIPTNVQIQKKLVILHV